MDEDFDLQGLEKVVESFLSGAEGDEALSTLGRQNDILQGRIPQNPFAAVRADVFPAAQALAQQAAKMAEEFRRRGDLLNEERVRGERTRPVLNAYGHHRHLVGPVMLEWAECNERLGNQAKAQAIYEAVIKDFLELLRYAGDDEASRLALNCLKAAIEKSVEPDLALLAKVEKLLAEAEKA